ncbi:MAG: mechanosensitive ion channel [Desulfatiglandaceae bacterium]
MTLIQKIPSLHAATSRIKRALFRLHVLLQAQLSRILSLSAPDRRWIIVAVVLWFGVVACPAFSGASDENAGAQSNALEVQDNLPSGLSDLIPKAAALGERLQALTRELEAMPDRGEIDSQLNELEASVDSLSEKLSTLKQEDRLRYERLVEFLRWVESANHNLENVSQPLIAGLRKIDEWRKEWRTELAYWNQWEAAVEADTTLPMVANAFENASRSIDTAQARLLRQMKAMMAVQKRVSDVQVRVNQLLGEVQSMISNARGKFLRDFSPPLYSPAFFNQFGRWMLFDLSSNLRQLLSLKTRFFVRSSWIIGLHLLLCLVITFGIRRAGKTLEGSESLRFMRRRPQSVGLLISTALCWSLYEPMPAMWQLLLTAIILMATARLLGSIIDNRHRSVLVYLLVAIILATHLLTIIGLPLPIFRIYLVSIASGLAILFVCFLRRPATPPRSRISAGILIGMAIASASVAVIEISGYSSLALLIFQATLRTVFIIVLAWLSMLLVRGLLESSLRSHAARKIPFLRTQATAIIDRTAKALNLLVLLLFFGAVLQAWRVFDTSWDLIYQVLTFGVTVGNTRITLGLALAATACLYGALLVSRALQFFLMQNVFSRRRVDPGIGVSVLRLLHYAIILVGVLLALATLGFELTNLTIIASALSVGIGFGLQTIVNNFVCGLILLFERPVKVGDIIQLGNDWATIRDIGLRATTIQTFDRADIVVPNSDLITNQVTNWTLADRNMRIVLSIGVAYGSDVPLVLQTLQECAQENPRVLQNPAPSIFFMGFGDSSLDFQVRVWIEDIDYMIIVRSELNQAIDGKFRERGIQIPFPQRDLHLRSADAPAPQALTGSSRADTATTDEEETS